MAATCIIKTTIGYRLRFGVESHRSPSALLLQQKSHPKVAFQNQSLADYLEAAEAGAAAAGAEAASEAAGAGAGAAAGAGAGAAAGAGAGAGASSFLPQAERAAAAAITPISTRDLFMSSYLIKKDN